MKNKSIEVPMWWKNGGMIYNRDCLPIDHPENTYNYIKNKLSLVPEEYGVNHPLYEKYKGMNKEELISKLIEYDNELQSVYQKGF